MKIDRIYQNYDQSRSSSVRNYSPNVSFSKRPKSMNDKILENLANRKVLDFMREKLDWMKGEFGGVAMTALGTGLVAPWPIAFNPFVKAKEGATEAEKEDVKNTKYYTAWRQPISAVLAAIFQLSALKPIDKLLDYMYNTPEIAKCFDVDTNQSLIHNDNFAKKVVKKQMNAEGLTKASMGSKEFKDELKARVKDYQNAQVEKVADSFKETHRIQVGKEFIDDHKVASIVNKEIDEYIKDAKKLKIDNDGLAYYSKKAKMLIDNETYLRDLLKNAPQESAELETYLKNLLSKETNPDIKVLLEEILDRKPEIRHHRIERSVARIDKIKNLCNGNYSFENYMNAMTRRNSILDNIITKFDLAKIEDVKGATPEAIEKSIKATIDNCIFSEENSVVSSILKQTGTFDKDKETITKKVYKDIAKGYKEFVKNSYKSPNQLWKILIGVCITLPITCNVLNWVYPRFMDKFFPKLAGAKANQKAREKEVK